LHNREGSKYHDLRHLFIAAKQSDQFSKDALLRKAPFIYKFADLFLDVLAILEKELLRKENGTKRALSELSSTFVQLTEGINLTK